MIYYLIRNQCGQRVSEDQVEELAQTCKISLWERSLPQFDRQRKTKLGTYVYSCIANFLRQEMRTFARAARRNKEMLIDPEELGDLVAAPDTLHDHQIDQIAEDLLKHPGKYLTRAQAAVFEQYMAHPEMLVKDLAQQLGYKQASSLSMMIKRIREKVAQLSIQDGTRP